MKHLIPKKFSPSKFCWYILLLDYFFLFIFCWWWIPLNPLTIYYFNSLIIKLSKTTSKDNISRLSFFSWFLTGRKYIRRYKWQDCSWFWLWLWYVRISKCTFGCRVSITSRIFLISHIEFNLLIWCKLLTTCMAKYCFHYILKYVHRI